MKNIIIIEDHEANALELAQLIKDLRSDVKIISIAKNGKEGISMIQNKNPDLVFLDVELGDMTGFDVLDAIDKTNLSVIFATGYDKYALRALKMSAIDYILKPYEKTEINIALSKFENLEQKSGLNSRFSNFVKNANEQDYLKKRIGVPQDSVIRFIALEHILFVQADGPYCHFFLVNNEKITYSKPLKRIDELIDTVKFYRVSQSFLVNTIHVKSINSAISFNGSDLSIEISPQKKSAMKKYLASEGFLFE